MDFKIPSFKHEKDLLDFIVTNQDDIIYSKKSAFKKSDVFSSFPVFPMKTFQVKEQENNNDNTDSLKATLIINTTKLVDSYRDIHIDGIWDKSLSENTHIKHLQEHKMAFDKIISDKDDLSVYTKNYTWKELGYDADGETQGLTFECNIRKNRNEYMFKQYFENNVDQHSVGMYYMEIKTCINDSDYGIEYENWKKYATQAANKEALDQAKYVWAVLEAKCIEGSAVPLGANFVTPTYSTSKGKHENKKKNKSNPYLDFLKY